MTLNVKMPNPLKPFFEKELFLYEQMMQAQNYSQAWLHLERAHIIGQLYPFAHSLVHWKMLSFGIKLKKVGEIIGQLPRLIFGGVKSFVGTIPTGNTGGANVSALKPLPIPADIMQMFAQANIKFYQNK